MFPEAKFYKKRKPGEERFGNGHTAKRLKPKEVGGG